MNEVWKDIVNYEGFYQVSNMGNVRSLDREIIANSAGTTRIQKGSLKKPTVKDNGYLQVSLYKENKRKIFYIHRLVAEAFIPNPENKPTIDHIDKNKANNNVNNLRWANQSEQELNKTKHKHIIQYQLDGSFVKEWSSAKEASAELGIFDSGIIRTCQGQFHQSGGYIWRYKNV